MCGSRYIWKNVTFIRINIRIYIRGSIMDCVQTNPIRVASQTRSILSRCFPFLSLRRYKYKVRELDTARLSCFVFERLIGFISYARDDMQTPETCTTTTTTADPSLPFRVPFVRHNKRR